MTDIELGGNIKLVGFREVDPGSMVILKKIIGNYARKFSDHSPDFQALEVTLKTVHNTGEGSHPKYEIHAKATIGGHAKASECIERNVFVGVDEVLKKVLHMISK
jgi:hypothetical protein